MILYYLHHFNCLLLSLNVSLEYILDNYTQHNDDVLIGIFAALGHININIKQEETFFSTFKQMSVIYDLANQDQEGIENCLNLFQFRNFQLQD